MSQENIEKIEKLEKAINSPATPENIKETMRKALELLKNGGDKDKKEIDSLIMKLISFKLQVAEYNDEEYNSSYKKLVSFGKEKVMEQIKDFINKNQKDASLFEGQNKVDAQEFVNRIFELQAELKYDFDNKVPSVDKKYTNIKSCLLDDGDDSDDYIYEGKLIHNVEVLPKDTWEIIEFYKYGVVLKHVPTSVLADSKPNKNVSLDELKSLFASDKIEIDGIEKGNTKLFNICIKAIIKCIDSIDMAAYKENLLAELNASKSELEKTIEASNLLESEKNAILSEKSNLEKESSEKLVSMEEAKAKQEAETARLKKELQDLEALNTMRTLIDMLSDDIAKKDVKPIENKVKIKVKEIRLFSAEGKVSGYGFPKVVNTYSEANDAVMPVYEDAIESSYANKCRFTVTFEDGETYDGDLYVGEKYDNPTKGNVIGKHIKDYLEREINENRQSEETKKEIIEFLEKYDLGFDNNSNPTGEDYDGIDKFVDYVNDFYGKQGIYASDFSNNGFTKEEIKEAIDKYISDIDKRDDDNFTWGGGDSIDRERVRQYLQPNGLKFKEGDFVFADIFKDKNKKVPFVVAHYSNGKYYILGDGSHYVSEDKLSLATEKYFDDYYRELGFDKKAIDSYKILNKKSIIDSDLNLLGEPKEPYLLTHSQFSSLIEDKNKILGRDYSKLKPLFEKYSVIKNGYEKIKEDVFSNPLLAYYIAHKSETSIGYTDTSHLDRNKNKTENAKYLINNIDKYPSKDEFKKYIKLIYFANQKSNENHKNIVEDALRLSYKGNETPEQSKSDYKRAIDRGEVSLDDVLFILKESKVEPTKEIKMYSDKFENGGSINDKITSKAKREVDFLTKKGYDIDVYSTLNQDAVFGGDKTEDFIIATQGSIGNGKDVKFAIAYWYKDDEDGVMQISRGLLDEISDLFKGSEVILYTNAGVDLHSINNGKHKNIQVVKVPYGEFSGNSDEYAQGGEIKKLKVNPNYKYKNIVNRWLQDNNSESLKYKIVVDFLNGEHNIDEKYNIENDRWDRILRSLEGSGGENKHEGQWRTLNYSTHEAEGWVKDALNEYFVLD